MVLEFRPPEDLIRAYMERPSPGQIASNGINQALQTYAQMKQQEQNKSLQERMLASHDASRKATQFGAIAPYVPEAQIPSVATQYGINIPGAQPAAPVSTGIPAEIAAQQSLPSEHTPSSLIDRWNAMQSVPGGGGPPKKPTSKFGREQYAKDLSIQKTERDLAIDPNAPVPVMSDDAALSAGQINPKTKIINTSNENQSETRQERLAGSFRKELTSSKPYQNLTTAKLAADNIEKAMKDPGAYGDLGLLFDYMKSLDPTSVVREGEQDTFRKTGSFTDKMANTMNKLVSGKTVTPEQRKEVLRYAKSRLRNAHDIYKNHAEPTLRQSERLKVDPLEVDPYYGQSFEDSQDATAGKSFIKPGEEAEYEAYKRSMAGGK